MAGFINTEIPKPSASPVLLDWLVFYSDVMSCIMGLRKRQKNQFGWLFQNIITNTSSQAKKEKPEDDSGEQVECESDDNIEEEIRNCIKIDDSRSRCSESISSSQSSKKKATAKQMLDICYSSSVSEGKIFRMKSTGSVFFLYLVAYLSSYTTRKRSKSKSNLLFCRTYG